MEKATDRFQQARAVLAGLGQRLREARGSRTQAEFAELLGVPRQQYARYEKGRTPDPLHLMHIAAVLGTTVGALLGERAAVDPASTADGGGALEQFKNQPDLLEHLARLTELLSSSIPALRAEVVALRAEIATLRASSAGAAAPDLVALVRGRFGPKTARAVARVLRGDDVRRANRNQGTSQ